MENMDQNPERKPSTSIRKKKTDLLTLGKKPPYDDELEQIVLGALMLEKNALTEVVEILKPETFHREKHQVIFNAIRSLFSKSEPIDLMTVTGELKSTGELTVVGGPLYIAQLTQKVNSAANIVYHSRLLLQYSIKRELIGISNEILRDAYEETTDVFELLDTMEQSLFEVSEMNIRKNYDDMQSLMVSTLAELDEMRNHKDGLTGVPSGFTQLDRVTSGWQRSDLIIVAARPAMGKCLGKGTKVLMFDGTLKKVEDVKEGELLMGDDSTPRKVLSIARGREKMYWVRQNKGIDYRVNESHILSLKRSRNEGPHHHGDVLNITVKEYLQKSDKFKSNYKGYRIAVEFAEKEVPLDPYYLGLWLGDGRCSDPRITNIDPEIIGYLGDYAGELEMELHAYEQEGKTTQYAITNGYKGGGKAYSIKGDLRKLNLIENKHIPEVYKINSTENRLKLLAGLIDSDGHYDIQVNGYEITQKNYQLAKDIKFLADSLGFRCSLKEKRASIPERGYEATVYRVRFFGDLDKIPVKVARKKARPWTHITDWRMTGITVEYDKVDDYFGFEIDGNRLFLLEDMTVTHNTAFVLSLMRNASVDHSKGVAIFSLEMASSQLVKRLISSEAEIESEKLKTGKLSDFEWEKLVTKTAKLTQSPIFIDDTPAISILELRAKCRRLKAQHDIQMVIIDYLQLMTGDTKAKGNREQEIASISRALKQIAKELNVPVIALSQLSRAVETRGGDKRPQLSDLRESGSIEQDADMVIFLYRPEYYGITEDENGNPVTGLGEVIIAKHRNGSLEDVPLKFIGKYTKFTDWSQDPFLSTGDFGSNTGFGPGETMTFGSKINESRDSVQPPSAPKPEDEEPPF